MRFFQDILFLFDCFNKKLGSYIKYFIFIILLIQVMEVILRYVFRSGTIWAWDVNQLTFSAISILGGAYVLRSNRHVRVDLLYEKFSPKVKYIIEIILVLILTIVFLLIFIQGMDMAIGSWQIGERYFSRFAPPVYPIKALFPVAIILLLMQVIANFVRYYNSKKNL